MAAESGFFVAPASHTIEIDRPARLPRIGFTDTNPVEKALKEVFAEEVRGLNAVGLGREEEGEERERD